MAKTLAVIFGVIFILVGLLGFVNNPLVGNGAVFAANAGHNIINLLIGLLLLVVGFVAPMRAARWLTISGVLYLLLALLGFAVSSPLLGFIEVNNHDHWLHLLLGVVLIVVGYKTKGVMATGPTSPIDNT